MSLTPEQIRALAPAPGHRRIDRYLPAPYRRALDDPHTPMAALTKAWRDALRRVTHELALVQRSRSVAFFTDLDDGARLGALHDQAPWPEEDTEAFRTRLGELAALAVAGAASARRMLSLVGMATGARLVDVVPPGRASYAVTLGETTLTGATGQGQTRGFLAKRAAPHTLFAADILDAPLRPFRQEARPLPVPGYTFRLVNPASATLPDLLGDGARSYPDPVFRLEAGAPFGPLALVQSFEGVPKRAPRIIVINRRLRPGTVLDIDVAGMEWNHSAGTVTHIGPWRLNGAKAALYAGLTEIASSRSHFDNEPGEPAAGYALTLRMADGLTFTGAAEDNMVDKGPIPPGPIRMPSLLGRGASLWRVLQVLPDPDGSDEITAARFAPLPADAALTITARWLGRRAGEFAVVLPERQLAPGEDGPLPHRADWLDAMIARFKLAGTVRVKPGAGALFAGPSAPDVELRFASRARPADALTLDPWGNFESAVAISDSLTLTTARRLNFASGVAAGDEMRLTPPVEARLESAVKLGDAVSLVIENAPEPAPARLDLADHVTLTDDLKIEVP